MILILILTRIYVLGIVGLALHAASVVAFSDKIPAGKLLTALVFSPIWPLALFSPAGRKKLLITSEKL